MIEQIKWLDWTFEIDKETTLATYKRITDGCQCAYCRNFRLAHKTLPSIFLQLLASFEIDPTKPSNITEYCKNEDGTHFYSGFYHFVGKIVEGYDCRLSAEPKAHKVEFTSLAQDFKIGFTVYQVDLAQEFPEPTVQVEFFTNIPWLLDEEP